MKIISKYKDYYDFLQGIWGMDEKLVLDRTDYVKTPNYISSINQYRTLVRFYICDLIVEGLYYQENAGELGVFLYGEEIENQLSSEMSKPFWKHDPRYYYVGKSITPRYGIRSFKVLKEPIKFFDLDHIQKRDVKQVYCPNDLFACPILIESNPTDQNYDPSKCCKFPVLKEYKFHSAIDAPNMWKLLTEWIGREKVIPNNQSNKEKVVSNGFDLKTSFRHPIK